ncbi:MAG: protein kinase, partial [Planctomycetota bacterium]
MQAGERDGDDDRIDAYLDLLLKGEEIAPDAFLAAHGDSGQDANVPEWLDGIWRLSRGELRSPERMLDDVPRADVPLPRVGSFELLRPLGEGGMGRVYLARQEPFGRPCAVKLLREEHESSPTARTRLEREARVLSGLRHEHLVRVLDAGTTDGIPWAAFELVPGRNLDEVCRERRPSVEEVVRWGVELADGLA